MISYIKEYKPVRRRLHIKNKLRLTLFLAVLVCAILIIFIQQRGASQSNYKPYQVKFGDTYWQIAKELQEQGYKPRADIRSIVDELIRESGIPAHKLKEGDTIYLPDV